MSSPADDAWWYVPPVRCAIDLKRSFVQRPADHEPGRGAERLSDADRVPPHLLPPRPLRGVERIDPAVILTVGEQHRHAGRFRRRGNRRRRAIVWRPRTLGQRGHGLNQTLADRRAVPYRDPVDRFEDVDRDMTADRLTEIWVQDWHVSSINSPGFPSTTRQGLDEAQGHRRAWGNSLV